MYTCYMVYTIILYLYSMAFKCIHSSVISCALD